MGAIGTAIGKGMKDEQYRCWVTQGGWLVVAGGRQGESAEVTGRIQGRRGRTRACLATVFGFRFVRARACRSRDRTAVTCVAYSCICYVRIGRAFLVFGFLVVGVGSFLLLPVKPSILIIKTQNWLRNASATAWEVLSHLAGSLLQTGR